MFRHECAMGLEGIISKRVDSRHEKWPVPQLGEGQETTVTCPSTRYVRARGSASRFNILYAGVALRRYHSWLHEI